ncbi:enamine deaminase RidA (YjgF/YER057c/UK114 family) [Nocardia tenerifensis]|uniref:Enamine deaminase RidA (YjgF/YER057c/UK114 family) n=1 Tax=Nocardia tenerifensis TaxID=228006 RepID=A0A318JYT0_9NOCA|nr:RidA family protein [Nocardia tenerifensis]PXX62206.1 enamine deaminase RidA (YjgF/YER057c/UK114 family) [Nocardia tenerifensis]
MAKINDRLSDVPGVAPGFGYAHAVTVSNGLAFVSGQIAVDAEGNLVGGDDMAAQTRQALTNLENVLHALGTDWTGLVKLTWFVTDTARLQDIRDVRDEFLRPALGDRPNPASTLVRVAGLFRPEFLVEVEAVVAVA